jgi:hypothetical protein
MGCTFWDTLGYASYPDSFHCIRLFHGGTLDSVRETGTTYKKRPAYAEVPKQANRGLNYGQYEVIWRWWKDGKEFEKSNYYLVIKGGIDSTGVTVTGDVGITQAGADKAWATATRALTDKGGFKLAVDGLDLDTSFTQTQSVVNTNSILLGSVDGFSQQLRPFGSANKDSVGIFNSSGTKVGTLYYFHTGSIIDSLRFEKW